MARLAAAVLLTILVLAGCFVLLLGPQNAGIQTLAAELSTVLITAWVTYYATVTRRP